MPDDNHVQHIVVATATPTPVLGGKLLGDLSLEHWPEVGFSQYYDEVWRRIHVGSLQARRLPGPNPEGLYLMMVGRSHHSRLIGFHPDDHHGVVYILNDDGSPVDPTWSYGVHSVITISTMLVNPYDRKTLDLDRHPNKRLRRPEPVSASVLKHP